MSPEMGISEERFEAIKDWVNQMGSRKWAGAVDPLGEEVAVYNIFNEPFVLYVQKRPGLEGQTSISVYCSNKHAQELERVGILNFRS